MSRRGKVLVAMSGGVDSSVAAGLLKQQGYECVGVFMRVGVRPEPGAQATGQGAGAARLRHGCCSVEDAHDARAVAGRLGIPLYVLNFRTEFERIIEYFVDEYARARTPNPCVLCNADLKFGKLLRYADALDAEFVATGHYARIRRGDVGRWGRGDARAGARRLCKWGPTVTTDDGCLLARARNLAKDQSYLLFGIRRSHLGRCVFPLGEIAEKVEVRRIAADLGLEVHDKAESQEICFVPNNDYRELVRARRPQAGQPGEIRDPRGKLLGSHGGIVNYTIGQRRGLGIAAGRPVYVTRLDAAANTVTLGPREDLLSAGLVAERANWLTDRPPIGDWRPAAIKIRHQHRPAAGQIRVRDDATVEARFDQPQSAVTPGQAAVFYDGDVVLGGGWIVRAL
jgi:tRNA-specific 2-thiouridylase